MSEGTELRADVELALFGEPGQDPLGTKVTRTRDRYRDPSGVWVDQEIVETRAFLLPTQPTNPYAIAEVAMSNIKNNEPTMVILPFSSDEPWETDKLIAVGWNWKMSNCLPVPVGDDIVYYQAEIVRDSRVVT